MPGHVHVHADHDHHHHDHGAAFAERELVCDECPCEGALGHSGPHRAGIAGRPAAERRRVAISLLLSALVMVAQVAGGVLSSSLALTTDALHSLTDVAALGLSLFAMVIALRPANARRTYGYHRLEILSALVNGVALLALSIWVGVEAVDRFSRPVHVAAPLVMVFAAIGLVAMVFSAWLLSGSHSVNVRGAYLHVLGDALTSLAVLVGAAVLWFYPPATWIDPALSLGIGLVIVHGAYRLVRETVEILIEAVPRGIDATAVARDIAAVDGIAGVHDLHIWTIASGVPALSAHVVVGAAAGPSSDAVLLRIKRMLMDRYRISHSTLQLESSEYSHLGH